MARPRLGSIRAFAFLVPFALSAPHVGAEQLSAEQWREDLRFLQSSLREIHPKPFFRTTEAAFDAEVADLSAAIPNLEDEQIVLRLMRLVADIGDGHTALIPGGPQPVRHAYPLRLHRFHDGVYVVFIDAKLAHLAGGRVVRIDGTPIEDAVARAEAVSSGDSELGRRWPASLLFTMPHVLHALGITSSPLEMSLTVATADGVTTTSKRRSWTTRPPSTSRKAWSRGPDFFTRTTVVSTGIWKRIAPIADETGRYLGRVVASERTC